MAGSTDAQAAEQLKHKVAEVKMVRTRVDCAKAEAEAAKQQAKEAKAAVEQVGLDRWRIGWGL